MRSCPLRIIIGTDKRQLQFIIPSVLGAHQMCSVRSYVCLYAFVRHESNKFLTSGIVHTLGIYSHVNVGETYSQLLIKRDHNSVISVDVCRRKCRVNNMYVQTQV